MIALIVLIVLIVLSSLGLWFFHGKYAQACVDRNKARAEADKLKEEINTLREEAYQKRCFVEGLQTRISNHLSGNTWD